MPWARWLYLQFEAMGIPRVKTKLSVCYVDHNMLQVGFENSDDHRFLQTMSAKYGLLFSRPGNGICHQVHLERFSEPGATLLGSDSHTPTCGAVGMLAIGAGGLDVAVAMGGGPYLPDDAAGGAGRSEGRAAALGGQPRTSSWSCCAAWASRAASGRIFEYGGDGRAAPHRPAAGHDLQHGHRAGRDHQHLPQRRDGPLLPEGPGARGGLEAAGAPIPTPATTRR